MPNYGVNTNLQQVSDWLTKILTGLGLIEFREMSENLDRASWQVADGLGGPQSKSFALALILYFSVLGFLAGYLLTRLYLHAALARAEAPAPVAAPLAPTVRLQDPSPTSGSTTDVTEIT